MRWPALVEHMRVVVVGQEGAERETDAIQGERDFARSDRHGSAI